LLKHETIFLIVGKSGSGKDTIADAMANRYGMTRLYSYTTRPSRGEGDSHLFENDFRKWVAANKNDTIVGYTKFNGHDYWATASLVENSDLYIIDPAGVTFMKEHYDGKKKIRVVYVDVPDHVCLTRMCDRGDGLMKATERVVHDATAFAGAKKMADFVVENNNLDECIETLWKYIEQEDGVFS